MKLGLAGDTMLGRGVAEALESGSAEELVAPEVVALAREADVFHLNLECCIAEGGEPWRQPGKPFFFRAPRRAISLLEHLGVDCVTLANNHALDFGEAGLIEMLNLLAEAGIAAVGAGTTVDEARAPAVLEAAGVTLGIVAATDHPATYAAGPARPGVAFADLWRGAVPHWLRDAVAGARVEADVVVASVHWGPNMVAAPVPHVRTVAATLRDAGVDLVVGHSAHVFHGVGDRVLYDLGDFLDDYAVDRVLRNDLGLLFLVLIEAATPVRLEAVPLRLDYSHTRVADGADAAWVRARFRRACGALGTDVVEEDGRLVVEWG